MVQKARSPGNTQVSISIGEDLLLQIDQRAASLGLSRSVYLAMLARNDLNERGSVVIQEINDLADNLRKTGALNETPPNHGLKEDTVDKVSEILTGKKPARSVRYRRAPRRKPQP